MILLHATRRACIARAFLMLQAPGSASTSESDLYLALGFFVYGMDLEKRRLNCGRGDLES